jgi:hypothetical protein
MAFRFGNCLLHALKRSIIDGVLLGFKTHNGKLVSCVPHTERIGFKNGFAVNSFLAYQRSGNNWRR